MGMLELEDTAATAQLLVECFLPLVGAEQAMTASQHGDQKLFQHVFLSDNYLVNLSFQFFIGLYKGLGHFFVVFGLLGGTHGFFLCFLDL